MTHTILLGTRKGLFVLRGAQHDWRIESHHFPGDPVSQILADPRDGAWYAAMNLGHFGVKLRKSLDRGANWNEIAAPAFPRKPSEGPLAGDNTPWNVEMIWSLEAGGAAQPGRLWAGCLPAGLFHSDDGGASWALNRALWEEPRRLFWTGGGYDHAGIDSIVVDPRDARHVTLAVSTGGVWQTHDDGAGWALTADGMRGDYMPEGSQFEPNAQDVHRMVACPADPDTLWVQHHCGIYRSTDGARSWQLIGPPAPSGFGFAVAVHPRDARRAWFVPAKADACRFPVEAQLLVNRTSDGGASFEQCRNGLPQQHAYHLIYRHALEVAQDGSTLAMASTTGGLWVSADAGENWQCLSRDLPPVAVLRFVA